MSDQPPQGHGNPVDALRFGDDDILRASLEFRCWICTGVHSATVTFSRVAGGSGMRITEDAIFECGRKSRMVFGVTDGAYDA